jgi:hypothetical protein
MIYTTHAINWVEDYFENQQALTEWKKNKIL